MPTATQQKQYSLAVQCRDVDSGTVGTFLPAGDDRAIAPVFGSLEQLYPWMRCNGFESDDSRLWGAKEVA
jgi:hypothetical protein